MFNGGCSLALATLSSRLHKDGIWLLIRKHTGPSLGAPCDEAHEHDSIFEVAFVDDTTMVGGPATGLGMARSRAPEGGAASLKPIGSLKPKAKPPPRSEKEASFEADPHRRPDGSALPRSKTEFQRQFPVPSSAVQAAAKDYLLWVTQEGSEDRGRGS